MTAPLDTQPSNSQPGGGPAAGITFTEIEEQLRQAEKTALGPKLDEMKFDGDEVPENLRGKTAREMLNRITEMENALRTSETGRQQALTMAQMATNQRTDAALVVKEPEPEPLITSEQVATAFSEDPAKGVDLMNKMTQQQIDRAGEHFMKRISPMLSGASGVVEAEARRKYPDEFVLFGDEIKKVLEAVPDKSIMSSAKSWDDMIAYVRGQDPKRLFDFWQNKDKVVKGEEAREAQRQTAGVSMSSSQRVAAPVGGVVIDETTREVCRVLDMSEEDYIKWSKVS